MNLLKMDHEVVFCGYRDSLRRYGVLGEPMRLGMSRSGMVRKIIAPMWLNRVNDEVKNTARTFRPDILMSIKGEAMFAETISWIGRELGAKTALWYPDDPRFFATLVEKIAPSYDYVFTVSARMIPVYKKIGVERVYYVPVACEPSIHRRIELPSPGEKRLGYGIVFVGAFTRRRAKIIKALRGAGIKVAVFGPNWRYFMGGSLAGAPAYGEQLVRIFNLANIVLNVSDKTDVSLQKANMRTYEATGCGSFLVTDNPRGMETEFELGKELVSYTETKELIETIRYFDSRGDLRSAIGMAGQRRAYRDHTYFDRVSYILRRIS